ncbi:hypothetical protein NE865_05607 [Phthorimaea operculella]|nr:hypothetical protein NE865_05607 [Phthorimaea operculella]
MDSGDLAAIAQNVKDLRKDLDNLYVIFYRTMDDCGIEPTETGAEPSTALATAMVKAAEEMEQEAERDYQASVGGPGVAPGRAPSGAPGRGAPGAPSTGTPGGAPIRGAPGAPGGPPGGAPGRAPAKRGGFKGAGAGTGGGSFEISDLCARFYELDRKLNKCCESVDRNGVRYQDKVDRLQDQVDYVLEQMGIKAGDVQRSTMSPDVVQDLQGLMQLFQTVQDMQGQLRQVHNTAMALAAEKDQRQSHINTLLEQIELLKVIKMDREDMAEAMAEKADIRMLQRKVSHDQFEMACDDLAKGLEHAIGKLNLQFEMACDDLAKGLEHAIGKLNLQEALWQQALDDIQREIETKLDKMELTPVKEFFYKKLKQLQENLKQLAQLRRDVEAAGAKRKLLRDVNCISCDANVVMATENGPCMPRNRPTTAMHSMKPYLTYELDTIRKTQAAPGPQRNMHDWETIDKQMNQQKPVHRVRSDTNKHICNRYCGGSHTVTTPAQRVARVGHFVKQWGPDVLPLSSGLAAGDDGKVRQEQGSVDKKSAACGASRALREAVWGPDVLPLSSGLAAGDDGKV